MQKPNYHELLQNYRLQIIFLGLGVCFILGGIFLQGRLNLSSSKVEVLKTMQPVGTNEVAIKQITIDVEGSLKNTGVYRLPSDSRVQDALQIAGGLTANADENWINKNLNKASKLVDGQKIFIPDNQQSNVLSATNSTTNTSVAQSSNVSDSNIININTASSQDLDTLPGIGQVYAQKIIDQRPYSDIGELTSKKILPQATFDKIKNLISIN